MNSSSALRPVPGSGAQAVAAVLERARGAALPDVVWGESAERHHHVWTFRLRAIFLVVVAAVSLLPPLTIRGYLVAGILLLVVLPYDLGMRALMNRSGKMPGAMAWVDQVIVAGFIAGWPELLGAAMAIGVLNAAVAAVTIDRRSAVRGALFGSVLVACVVGWHLVRLPDDLAETAPGALVAYAMSVVVTAWSVGTATARHRSARDQLRALLDSLEVVVYEIDAETLRVRYVSPYITTLYGGKPESYLGDPVAFLENVHRRDLHLLLAMVADLSAGRQTHDLEYRQFTTQGELRWVRNIASTDVAPDGRILIRGTLTDITKQKMAELALATQARTDALTGLPNRAQLLEAMAGKPSSAHGQLLVFLDVDDFKRINDSLGHKAGDDLLCEVAARLTAALRRADIVARIGGDEFVVLAEVDELYQAGTILPRILSAFRQPFQLHGRMVGVTASAGSVRIPVGCPDRADVLLEQADLAMYAAKNAGPGRHTPYTPTLRSGALAQLDMESEIRTALLQEQFHIVYQPVVGAVDRTVVGHEALVRWDHPVRGLINPVDFIPVAEKTGQISELGRWVLFEACAQARRWLDAGEPSRIIGVNLSAHQLGDPRLVDDVSAALRAAGLPADSLCLEITETSLIRNPEQALTTLRAVQAKGTIVALDDFGTGYSSLSHLHRYPVDVVKIDKSFVAGVGDGADRGIVTAILHLAHHMGLKVVAEGVETSEQADVLSRLGCDLLQGFALGPPAKASAASPQLQSTAL